MLRGLFDMDRPFWRWMSKIPELIVLSVFWFICSIPIITILPASCALFDAISRYTLQDNQGSFRRFFRCFWRELKQGIPLTLFWLIIAVITYFGTSILALGAANDPVMQFLYIAYLAICLLTVACLCWLVPLQSRYHNRFLMLHVNSIRLMLGRLPSTALMLLSTVLVFAACFIHPAANCLLLIAPALNTIFHAIIVEKTFQKIFPGDYVNGELVTNEQERAAALAYSEAKQAEEENAERS